MAFRRRKEGAAAREEKHGGSWERGYATPVSNSSPCSTGLPPRDTHVWRESLCHSCLYFHFHVPCLRTDLELSREKDRKGRKGREGQGRGREEGQTVVDMLASNEGDKLPSRGPTFLHASTWLPSLESCLSLICNFKHRYAYTRTNYTNR